MYNGSYKVADYMGIQAQPINGDHLKLYQKRDDLWIEVKTYIKNGKILNSEK